MKCGLCDYASPDVGEFRVTAIAGAGITRPLCRDVQTCIRRRRNQLQLRVPEVPHLGGHPQPRRDNEWAEYRRQLRGD